MNSYNVMSDEYWARRLEVAKLRDQLHHAVFLCSEEEWTKIGEHHKAILKEHIKPTDSVLDAGCGYGRLLELMPTGWDGWYAGVDISPALLEEAKIRHPYSKFIQWDLTNDPRILTKYDWAVCVAVKTTLIGNGEAAAWEAILKNLLKSAKRVMILDYDPEGSPEILEGMI